MKITRLEIKNRATLADVKADFADVNVIYGRNGTGKTLVSEIFRAAENSSGIEPGTATVHLDNRRIIRSSEFTQGELSDRIRVFNRKFVEENVFGRDPMAIVLGSEIKEQRDRADALQMKVDELESDLSRFQEEAKTEMSSLDQLKISCGKRIRDGLGPIARVEGADLRWRNFDKSDVDRVSKEIGDESKSYRRDENRTKLISSAIADHSFPKVPDVTIRRPDSSRWFKDTTELCAKQLGSSLLDELSRNPRLASWLEKGLALMQDGDDCPFCEQSIPGHRVDQLRGHFTGTHRELGDRVNTLKREISDWLDDVADSELPDPEKLRVDLRGDYRGSIDELQRMINRHRKSAGYLLNMLERKRTDLSAPLRVEGSLEGWVDGTIGQVNQLIRTHNDQGQVVRLGREYERAQVAGIAPELNRGTSEVKRLEREIASIEAGIQVKTREREVALRASRSEARAAAQLTELLGEFVGHHEIAVELNEDGSTFRLVRGGKKLIEPSEGEHNALGLMYFLMRLEDDSFKPAGAIVVFDDPITSFDDQRMIDAITKILYRTGSIRGSDRRVGQIFFLTHHLGLLDRLWRELKQHRIDAEYFEMRSSKGYIDQDRRTTVVKVKTPTRFRYHIAFEEVYDMAVDSKPVSNPGNSIRLCIEGFLFNMAPTTFDDDIGLERKLRQVYLSYGGKRFSDEDIHALVRAANAGSHYDLPDRPVNDADELAKFQGAAEKLLLLIEEVEHVHYTDMVNGVKKRRRQ